MWRLRKKPSSEQQRDCCSISLDFPSTAAGLVTTPCAVHRHHLLSSPLYNKHHHHRYFNHHHHHLHHYGCWHLPSISPSQWPAFPLSIAIEIQVPIPTNLFQIDKCFFLSCEFCSELHDTTLFLLQFCYLSVCLSVGPSIHSYQPTHPSLSTVT